MNLLLINSTKSAFNAVNKSLKGTDVKIILSESVEKVLDEVPKYVPRVVMINFSKDDIGFVHLCKKIRRLKLSSYIYIIIIADRDRQKDMQPMIDAGANEFIFKPFGKEELFCRIQIAQKWIKLENTATKSRKTLIKLAKEDPLTNLLNRRALMDEMLNEMGRASRETKYLSSIRTSVINFKEIVELHGKDMGKDILVEFARRIQSCCRPYDKVGRYGNTDFLIFLPDSGESNAEKVADRLMESITQKPFGLSGTEIDVSISIGISELNPDEVRSDNSIDQHLVNDLLLDSLIRRSKQAMDKATEKGNNMVELYTVS